MQEIGQTRAREGAKEVKPRESRLGMAVTICVMVGVVLLPLAYIALIGPVLWLAERLPWASIRRLDA
jgi:hypothetical protein